MRMRLKWGPGLVRMRLKWGPGLVSMMLTWGPGLVGSINASALVLCMYMHMHTWARWAALVRQRVARAGDGVRW